MSYISRVGNLASAPTLKHGDHGPYLYARILVTDRIRKDGEWVDGPTVPYEVAVSGQYAVNLDRSVQAAGGKLRVFFSGRSWTEEFTTKAGETRLIHKVKADEIGASFQFDAYAKLATAEEVPAARAAEPERHDQLAGPAVAAAVPAGGLSGSAAAEAGAIASAIDGAGAYEEMGRRVSFLVQDRYLRPEHATELMSAAEALVQNAGSARGTFVGALAPLGLPAAAALFLTCVIDQLEGTGRMLSWNEAAATATAPVAGAPAASSVPSAENPWDSVAEARRDVGMV